MSVVPTQEDVWPPVGGTGGNDGSQPGEAEAFASSGGGRLRVEPLSRPECAFERGTPETRERNRTGIGGGGPHAAPSTARLCTCVCVRPDVPKTTTSGRRDARVSRLLSDCA